MMQLTKLRTTALFLLGAMVIFPSCKKLILDSGKYVSQERGLDGEFSSIDIDGSIDLFVNTQDNESLVVEAGEKLLPYIKTEVYEDGLHIYVEANSIRNEKQTKVFVSADILEKIAASGSGDVEVVGINGGVFTLIQSGSGDSHVELGERTSVTINDQGSGDVSISGTAISLNTNSSGSGETDARNLTVEIANISMNGSGDVRVNVTESLTAQMNGSGDLLFWGDPEIVNIDENGSGDSIAQ